MINKQKIKKQILDKQQTNTNKRFEILVCDYCGKQKPENTKPCSCGKGSFWVIKE